MQITFLKQIVDLIEIQSTLEQFFLCNSFMVCLIKMNMYIVSYVKEGVRAPSQAHNILTQCIISRGLIYPDQKLMCWLHMQANTSPSCCLKPPPPHPALAFSHTLGFLFLTSRSNAIVGNKQKHFCSLILFITYS